MSDSINFSDPYYSKQQERVNRALQNIDEFSDDFQCASNTLMNSKVKCEIF